MLPCLRFPAVRRYRVEVSGWDTLQNFFVENCDLVWTEESGKQVTLGRKLGGNAILFVRLLEPRETDRAHPVVYEAQWVGETVRGLSQFRLSAVAPRLRAEEPSAA